MNEVISADVMDWARDMALIQKMLAADTFKPERAPAMRTATRAGAGAVVTLLSARAPQAVSV